jgi:hypothetical protein
MSKQPPTLEEAKVPLNSAKRALRKMEKSLDSQIAGQLADQIENRKTLPAPSETQKSTSAHRLNFIQANIKNVNSRRLSKISSPRGDLFLKNLRGSTDDPQSAMDQM